MAITLQLKVNSQIIQNRQLRFQMENSRQYRVRAIVSVLVCWVLIASPTISEVQAWNVTVQSENDSYPGWGDDDYTNGLRISLDINRALWWSSFSSHYKDCHNSNESPCRRTTLMVGQNFYTPDNITVSEVQEDERPYSAWLYVAAAARIVDTNHLRTVELHIGTTGKAALGKEVQTWWHDLSFVKAPKPQGWDHQVKPVPGLVGIIGIWDDKHLSEWQTADSIRYADFVQYRRFAFGNVHINAAIGATFRFGYNLPHRWAERNEPIRFATLRSTIIPNSRNLSNWLFYGFISIEGRAVAWNALLQHDTYTPFDSRPINRAMAIVEAGIELGYKTVSLGFRLVWRSPEFDTGRESKYGGVFITINPKGSD